MSLKKRLKKQKKQSNAQEKDKQSYEDNSDLIDGELRKRKSSWFLTSINWIDFDDVCQLVRIHINAKWDKWDQKRPIKPWLNKIISNQFKNILRNYYTNFAKPCLNCPFNEGTVDEGVCAFTKSGLQDSSCPLYKKWSNTKKYAHDVKVALPLEGREHYLQGANSMTSLFLNFDDCLDKIRVELKKKVNLKQYELFNLLFVENIPEERVAEMAGYKSTESGRRAGYKQIKNTKKILKKVVEKIIREHDLY